MRQLRDRNEWLINPHEANAYYDPSNNKIVIPAGILNKPFFYAEKGLPSALNFGAVGGVAGHEVTHGFDTMGRQFDELGSLSKWWTKYSDEEFTKRTGCLVDKYSNYSLNGLNVKGDQTLPENIADDGAVKVAFQAFKKYGNTDKRLIGLGNLTGDQLFFIGWSQVWCTVYTPESLRMQILVRPHSPVQFRVNGPLSNSDDFAKAYNCPLGSGMNPGSEKCSIW